MAPVILVARTALGTINHTILTLQALRNANCTVIGVAFVGNAEPDVEKTIVEMGNTRFLGRLPYLDPLSPTTLSKAFATIDTDTIRRFL
ncbi:ATP-dependent dethiobiotin synthetase BioD [Ruegeria arenilitoris]|uniref:ATP-dependent dethiobiotin synthetase BioD n=1 Tax=Ruegeria arenilitoris TaxID=1173585 RepID=UPI003464C481